MTVTYNTELVSTIKCIFNYNLKSKEEKERVIIDILKYYLSYYCGILILFGIQVKK